MELSMTCDSFSNLKIALVHDWLNGMRGGEKVLEQLCRLFPLAPIFTLHSDLSKIVPSFLDHAIHHSFIQKLPFKNRFYRWYLPLYPFAVKQFNFKGYDLVLSTSHCAVKNISVPSDIPHLCYCFSPMRYIWELQDDYFGNKRFKRVALSPILHWLQNWDYEGTRNIKQIIAISKTVQERIRKYYNREAECIYPPMDIPFSPSLIKSDYYLILSALVPYKKIELAILACNEIRHPLQIIGSGPELKRLKKMAGPTIQFLGWLPDKEKKERLRSAKALLFPGLEDFGIVPVEAMAYATPVIGYDRGGLTETVQDGKTGCLFKEQTVESMLQAMKKAEQMTFSAKAFKESVDRFTPAVFLEKMKKTIQETLCNRK
jgi:glycosyltransferase involved in cell wall biosynthesis